MKPTVICERCGADYDPTSGAAVREHQACAAPITMPPYVYDPACACEACRKHGAK